MTELDFVPRFTKLLGGANVFGPTPPSRFELVERMRRGLPYASLVAISEGLHFSNEETARALAVPLRTLVRRRGGKLSPHESERVVRLARVAALAFDVFESESKGRLWLNTPNRALGGSTPLSLLDTDVGTQAVEDELLRIEHGHFA